MSYPETMNKFVPLPEVARLEERVVVGPLGLPVGFDESRLGVNLRGLDSVRRLIGVDVLRITSVSGEPTDVTISGLPNPDGSLAGNIIASSRREVLSSATFSGGAAVVLLNTSAMTAKFPKQAAKVRCAQARAHILNRAIKLGLAQTAYESLEIGDKFGATFTALLLGAGYAAAASDGYVSPTEALAVVGLNPFVWALYARDTKSNPSLLPL